MTVSAGPLSPFFGERVGVRGAYRPLILTFSPKGEKETGVSLKGRY